MQQADFNRFKAVMTGMAKVYEREIDGVLLDAYWIALRDWALDDFERAAGQLMRSSKFMPRPADFAEMRKAGEPTSGEAWAAVLAHIKRGMVRWTDGGSTFEGKRGVSPKIDRVVEMLGGYQAIGHTPLDKLPFVERRFAEHYADLSDREETRAALGHPDWLQLSQSVAKSLEFKG